MIFYETLIQSSGPTRSHLARFARARFTLHAHENLRKKSVSQSTRNALKRIEMQKKKKITPYECFFPLPQNA